MNDLLDLLELIDMGLARRVLREGGYVLVAIVFASMLAWMLLVGRYLQLFTSRREFTTATETQGFDLFNTSRSAELWVSGQIGVLRQGLGPIQALAVLLPLLGLLGTVLGMLKTFEVIQLEGTGDPRLMADGIRQALLTTQAGILAALPVLLGLRFLSSRTERFAGLLERTVYCSVSGSCGSESSLVLDSPNGPDYLTDNASSGRRGSSATSEDD